MEKCRRLWEYSEFIAEVNDNRGYDVPLKAAITKAIDHCIQRGILEELLRKNQTEVLHMLLTEYDEKSHMRSIYEEGEEAGYLKGEQAGYRKGEADLLTKMVRQKLESVAAKNPPFGNV